MHVFTEDAITPTRREPTTGDRTMLKKAFVVLTAAFVVTTSLVSVADAQRASNQVAPFTAAEQNWFDIAEQPERLPK
jgi:hypothetical protein